MAFKDMIFSEPMAAALWVGLKTQTRRTLKPQPSSAIAGSAFVDGRWAWLRGDDGSIASEIKTRIAAGDMIVVRENFRVGAWQQWSSPQGFDQHLAFDYPATGTAIKEWVKIEDPAVAKRLIQQSRGDAEKAGLLTLDAPFEYRWSVGNSPCRKRPSIHMPWAASRMTLEVTEVVVQRLDEISRDDAIYEGLKRVPWASDAASEMGCDWSYGSETRYGSPVSAFADLWRSINGKGSWDLNPWVVAYKFKVHKANYQEFSK